MQQKYDDKHTPDYPTNRSFFGTMKKPYLWGIDSIGKRNIFVVLK
jgi:hypothetical protein